MHRRGWSDTRQTLPDAARLDVLLLRLSRKARRLFHFRGSPGTFPVEAALGDIAQLPGSNRRKPMAKELKKLDELFHDTLKDIYFAEKKILAALPKMAKAARDRKLQAAFEKAPTPVAPRLCGVIIDEQPPGPPRERRLSGPAEVDCIMLKK